MERARLRALALQPTTSMPFVRRLRSVQTKLLLLLAGFVVTFAAYVVVRDSALARVMISGPMYQVLAQRGALVADTAQARLSLLELFFNAQQMVEAASYGDWAQVAGLMQRHEILEADHRLAARYWRLNLPDRETIPLLDKALDPADRLIDLINADVIPAVRRGDIGLARSIMNTHGTKLFAVHRAASTELSLASRQLAADHERRAAQYAAFTQETLLVAGFVILATFSVIAIWGTRKLVLKPVGRAIKHFETIGSGNYALPVLTRREDEFGDMLRALDRMRLNLARMESEIERSERRYALILERSVQGFYEVTTDGRLLAVNPSLATMLGYDSTAELLEVPVDRLYVEPIRRAEFVREIQEHGFVSGFRAKFRRKDGRVIWTSEFARAIFDEDGRCVRCEGFIEEITERIEAEQLKSDFVAFVTHQLRTPLAGIRWMLELAQGEAVPPDAMSFIEDARVSAERLIALVNDLLDIARLEGGQLTSELEATDLVTLASSVIAEVTPIARARNQTIVVTGERSATVLVDPHLARQALMNFLSNAVKYTPYGGTITVSASADDEVVRWSVRDTGIGIPAGAQRRLFEKFYRAENALTVDTEGTGLGLYLVRLIAERSGGSVSCESVEREGSTFTLTLPLTNERKAVA